MSPRQTPTPHQRQYMERFMRQVEESRRHPVTEAEIARIEAEMRDEDPAVRARACGEICPCRMSWEVFNRLRRVAKPLQHDPDPDVAGAARHIEEDARKVAGFESVLERLALREETDKEPAARRRAGRGR